jgi:acetyl-CoA carboxylase / biotin carboxylase 1
LTGATALNNLLGREVYLSNLQLGGTQIMYNNGVSHIAAKDDLHGVCEVINWLSYVPEKKNAPVPVSPSIDDWDREVEYTPPKGVYDVRWLLDGKQEDEHFLKGFFDRGSFRETLGGWARTVVCT